MTGEQRVLVTGARGYVGGQLIPALLEAGVLVRVLTRSALRPADWARKVDIVRGDATEAETVRRALHGVDTAYYLLHSMDGGGDLRARERQMAQLFAREAAAAGVRRIVYLGGMHPSGELSDHLGSRAEVGEILLAGEVPAVVLQAAVILGAGSASFDMVRYLTYRLPVVLAPSWVHNRLQPIAIEDVVRYLVGAMALPDDTNRSFDIGGPEVLSYADLIDRFAAVAGLPRRVVLPVPVPPSTLAGYGISLIAPVTPGLAAPLVASLRHDAVADETDIRSLLPFEVTGIDEALRRAEAASPRDTGALDFAIWAAASGTASALDLAGRMLRRYRGR